MCPLVKNIHLFFALTFSLFAFGFGSSKLLIPMDLSQTDHLKAYGVAYWALQNGYKGEWLLNYRGGSFFFDDDREIQVRTRLQGVSSQTVSVSEAAQIYASIAESNMESVKLEKAARIAIYAPPTYQPWDDAVMLAFTYAEIPFEKIWDREVLSGKLDSYDWLHLHHEDFTGQFSKFFATFGSHEWYRKQQTENEKQAGKLGYSKVSELKKAVSIALRAYVERGGFLFAMCCAPNTLDISLAALGTDICETVYDGDPVAPGYKKKLDFSRCFAFENFEVFTAAADPRHDNIDVNWVNTPMRKDAADFSLFDFSAKYDPVPCMLVQDHVNYIKGFFGLATSFNRAVIKKGVTVLGEVEGTNQVRYIHGNLGRGQFTFYGGHDPEDYAHEVGSPPTDLSKQKNSPGYRLILNNVLFPSAKTKKLKT